MRPAIAVMLALLLGLGTAQAAEQENDQAEFDAWLKDHSIKDFEDYLATYNLNGVLPTRHIVRTATDWRKCGAPRFEIPPRDHWKDVAQVLELVAELKQRKILKNVEGASAYRNPQLNVCAHGAPRSAHTLSWAIDLVGDPDQVDVPRLCEFWRDGGRNWRMGLSRYPSGRIHLDVSGWRTWGADHTRKSSFCVAHWALARRQSSERA